MNNDRKNESPGEAPIEASVTIRRRLATSGAWSVTAAIFNNFSSLAVFIALARLLSPTEFGIVAFATIFIEFGRTLVFAGMPDALVQRKEWDQEVATTAFWTNLAVGALMCVIVTILARPLAGAEYDSRFGLVLAALSITLLIDGSTAIHVAKLRREFRYKEIATRQMGVNLLSGLIGVALAYFGWNVWALVATRIIASTATAVVLWMTTSFRPSLLYSFAHLRSLRRFGVHQTASQLASQGNSQVMGLVVGAFLGPVAIAQYRVGSRALNTLVRIVISPLQSAAMTAFSQVHHKSGEVATAYLRLTRACAVAACPVFFGLAAVAPDFVDLVFGKQWAPASGIMVALALSVGPATLNYFQGPALSGVGRSGLAFWATLTGFVGNTIIALITVRYGLIYVAIGHTVRAHLTTPISLRFVQKGIGVSPLKAISNITPPYLCAAFMAGCIVLLRLTVLEDFEVAGRLAICIAAGILIYALSLLVFARRFLKQGMADLEPLMPSKVRGIVQRFAGFLK